VTRTLVTIPISHFCEKARWALARAGLQYTEQRHVQIVHIAAAKRAGGRTDDARPQDAGGIESATRRQSCDTPTITVRRSCGCTRATSRRARR
jgi:hypothetical protein